MHTKRFIYGIGLALMVFALVGCGSSNNSLAPFQPQIANAPDNFQFQATGVSKVSTVVIYTWSNSGTSATVNQSCAIASGTAMLVILDSNGTQVYSNNLTGNGTFPTTTGVAGNWTIRVTLSNNSGTLNFRAQKV